MAMAAVWAHRFRSVLTVLGIVIGITTVVVVASLLSGLRAGIVHLFRRARTRQRLHLQDQRRSSSDFASIKERKRKPIKNGICGRHPPLRQHSAGCRPHTLHSARAQRQHHHRESAWL